MKVGDLVEWEWWIESVPGVKVYRGVIISEKYEGKIRILKVVDQIGVTEVRAEQVRVISESR